jgi:hypothetical protein
MFHERVFSYLIRVTGRQTLDGSANSSDPAAMSSPGAHRQHQMEQERREREARELAERTRLKRAMAKHSWRCGT